MEIQSIWVTCDGCGLPAAPAHFADRLHRLEHATRYRPIHISILFVAAAPMARPEDDFYRPPESRKFFDPFMEAVDIPAGNDVARLVEFQRRGYYISYLSECPISREDDSVSSMIVRLGPTLLRRVRFNYRPRQIAILGSNLSPLRDILEKAGLPSTLLSRQEVPNPTDASAAAQFREALSGLAPRDNPSSEYGTIGLKQP